MESNNGGNVREGNTIPPSESSVKPVLTLDGVPELLWRLYGFQATDIKQLPSYDDLNFFFKVQEHRNEFVETIDENGYVLKVMNSIESKKEGIIDGQHAFIRHVREQGLNVQKPEVNLQQRDWSLEFICDEAGGKQHGPYVVRVFHFMPGAIFHETPYVAGSFYNVGRFMGRLHRAFEGFHHPFFDTYENDWQMTKVSKLSEILHAVQDPERRRMVEEVMAEFQDKVMSNLHRLEKSIIHGDINEQNLLMREVPGQQTTPARDRIHDVSGLIDFNDASFSYLFFDVAICICYMSIDCKDEQLQLDVGGHVLSGYLEEAELNELEMRLLRTCVCARLCQTLVFGAYTFFKNPGNEYLLFTSRNGWACLSNLWQTPEKQLMARWEAVRNSYKQSKS